MSATLMAVFLLTLVIGVPIAFTMLAAGLAAVWMQGSLPPMVSVQQMFAGLDSFPLMAIPFFILAAELMTGGALTEVLLRFASSAGRPRPRRPRPRQRPDADLLLGHQRLGARRRRRPGRDADPHDAPRPATTARLRRRADGGDGHRRADHPAVDHHDRSTR